MLYNFIQSAITIYTIEIHYKINSYTFLLTSDIIDYNFTKNNKY